MTNGEAEATRTHRLHTLRTGRDVGDRVLVHIVFPLLDKAKLLAQLGPLRRNLHHYKCVFTLNQACDASENSTKNVEPLRELHQF